MIVAIRDRLTTDVRNVYVNKEYGGQQTTEPTGQVVVFPAPAPGAGKP